MPRMTGPDCAVYVLFNKYTYIHIARVSMDQPGKVANPARGQLSREINISLSAFVRA